MQEIARRIAKVSKESKLEINENDYVKSFKVELMDAVVQWCRGASFSDICKVCGQTAIPILVLLAQITGSIVFFLPIFRPMLPEIVPAFLLSLRSSLGLAAACPSVAFVHWYLAVTIYTCSFVSMNEPSALADD